VRTLRRHLRLTALAVVVLAVGSPVTAHPPAAAASRPRPVDAVAVAPRPPRLDGFKIGYVPAGLTAMGRDSWYTASVGPRGLAPGAPAPGEPGAEVSLRIFERPTSGMWIWISVLRPVGSAAAGTTLIRDWLLAWSVGGGRLIAASDMPAGPARVYADAGTETTTHQVIIVGGQETVIAVSGAGVVPVSELVRVAHGISV
jgi:hypothetical protein